MGRQNRKKTKSPRRLEKVRYVSEALERRALLSAVSFDVPPQYPVGNFPQSAVSGDFNGDRRVDLAVGYNNGNGHAVSVLLNNGDGTFGGSVDYTTGNVPASITTGDFNGDGYSDLAAANSGSGTVSVLRNNGDGTFASKADYAVGPSPDFITTADFNGDGKSDLAVGFFSGSNVCILLNNGNGTFAGAVAYVAGLDPRSIATSDFNGDGKTDLAIASSDVRGGVSVLLNNGDGTFAGKIDYAGGTSPSTITAGDFNGDGKIDLAAGVSVLLNDGNGTFVRVDYFNDLKPSSVATGDFNGDGKADLVRAFNSANIVSILVNNGNGTFTSRVDYAVGISPCYVMVDDFNGDGKADLATINHVGKNVSILWNNGDGTFASKIDNTTGSSPLSVATGDFNGDGNADLVTVNGGGTLSVFLSDGDGTFAKTVDYSAGTYPFSVTTADFDGDGKADLAVANLGFSPPQSGVYYGNSVSVLLSNGDGTFAPKVDYIVGTSPGSIATADFNDDGKADLAVGYYNSGRNVVSILLNNGNGTFGALADYPTAGSSRSVTTGDFNGDCKVDVVVANYFGATSTVSVLLNTGDGTFAGRIDYPSESFQNSVTTGDFNGDGKPDLAVASGSYFATGNVVGVLLNNGDGTFASVQNYAAASYPVSIVTGDFNGDGSLDLAVANSDDNTVSILLNNRDGTFAPKIDYAAGSSPSSVTTGDFNGDGKADLAAANLHVNTIRILINTTGRQPAPIAPGLFNSPGRIVTLLAPGFNWNVAGNASEYGLYISQLLPDGTYKLIFDSTDPTNHITIPGDASTYALPAGILQDGGQYRWNMNAKINGMWGPYTNRLYFKISTTPVPSTPTGLSAMTTGPTSVALHWNDVAGAITYKLYRSTSSNGPWVNLIYNGPASDFADFGEHLLPATTYYYRVAASNAGGDSQLSAATSTSTTISIDLPPPVNFHVTGVTEASVSLIWDAAADANSYVIERRTLPSGVFAVLKSIVGQTTYEDGNLDYPTPTVRFEYRLRKVVDGNLSNPALISTMVSKSNQQTPTTAAPLPLTVDTAFRNVAKIWEWDDTSGNYLYVPDSKLASIDWTRNTILITHGWNDQLDGNEAIMKFARVLSTSGFSAYNILAVDWRNIENSSLGSNPNNQVALTDIAVEGIAGMIAEANQSYTNGVNAAYYLADKLAAAGMQPENVELIGHSNGAGFMANLATDVYYDRKRRGFAAQRFPELVALDAPYMTGSNHDVDAAAAFYVEHVSNYYLPLVQSSDSAVWGAEPALGFGRAILGRSNVGNFELNAALNTSLVGHSTVFDRFVSTAARDSDWGFAVSRYATGFSPDQESGFFQETYEGVFKEVPQAQLTNWLDQAIYSPLALTQLVSVNLPVAAGRAITAATVSVVKYLGNNIIVPTGNAAIDAAHRGYTFTANGAVQIVDLAQNTGQAFGNAIVTNSQSLFDTAVVQGQAVVNGIGSSIDKSITYVTDHLGWISFGDGSPAAIPGAPVSAPPINSALYASVSLRVPENAQLMSFDLTVNNPGNDDILEVAVGNQVIGQLNLSAQQISNGPIDLWMGEFARQLTTLSFLMPSDVASAADFVVGNVRFASFKPLLAGDANHDGSVGFPDLVAVAQNYGKVDKTWQDGDFDGDGRVDFRDLVTVAQNYGKPLAASAPPVLAVAAPQVKPLAAKIAPSAKVAKPSPSKPPPVAANVDRAVGVPPKGIFASAPIKRRRMVSDLFR